MQEGITLCPAGTLSDEEIRLAYNLKTNATVMTVSRRAAQRVNNIVVDHLFARVRPLSTIPCASVADLEPIFPHRNMKVIFTENRDKQSPVVNGQEATILSSQNNTIILRLPEGNCVFVYPVTTILLRTTPSHQRMRKPSLSHRARTSNILCCG